jgi:transcriptional regulator with XRE-family HTH domain
MAVGQSIEFTVDERGEPSVLNGTGPKARITVMTGNHQTRFHRIATVRKRQGMSLRSVARRLGIKVRQVLEQEDETSDLRLSTLRAWHRALDVPLTELLVEADGDLSTPVLQRARMIRVMKTVAAIRQESDMEAIKHLADRLYDDLTDIMPELKDVSPWPAIGSRRPAGDCGRIMEQRIADDSFLG